MAKKLGDKVEARTTTIGLADSDEDCAVGDAVALASGDLTPGDASAGHELTGVRAKGDMSGDQAPATVSGIIVANVDSGVTAGSDLDLVDTSVTGAPAAGTLVASSGGPAHALSDEGGSYKGASIPDGAAAVLLR